MAHDMLLTPLDLLPSVEEEILGTTIVFAPLRVETPVMGFGSAKDEDGMEPRLCTKRSRIVEFLLRTTLRFTLVECLRLLSAANTLGNGSNLALFETGSSFMEDARFIPLMLENAAIGGCAMATPYSILCFICSCFRNESE